MDYNIIHGTVHAVGGNLGQNGITPGSHIRCADHQTVKSIVIYLHGHGCHIHAADGGTLHSQSHPHAAYFSVPHIAAGIFLLPSDHFPCAFHTAVQGTAAGSLSVVGRHHIPFPHHILLSQNRRVHGQLLCQLIDNGFHCEYALSGSISPVGACRHMVGVHHVIGKPVSIQTVQGDGFVTG